MSLGALLVAAALLWLPGAAVLRRLRPSADGLVLLAAAPLVSFGLIALWADVVAVVGVRVSVVSVLLPVALLALVLLVLDVLGVASRRRAVTLDGPTRADRLQPAQWGVLAAVSAVALVAWWTATDSLQLVPPGTDGQHHGLMAQGIVDLGTLDVGSLLTLDVLDRTSGGGYYPLGLHVVAALVAMVTGAPVAVTLNAVVVLACAVVLPAGMALLTRRLFPGWSWAPVVAGLAAVAFPAYPYFLGHWGMYPLLVALALAAPALEMLLACVDELRAPAGGLLLGLSLVALLSVHGSELVLVVLLGLVLVVGDVVRRGRRHLRTVVVRGLVALPLLMLAIVPRLSSVGGTPSTLAEADVLPPLSPGEALVFGRTFLLGPLWYMGAAADDLVGPRSDLRLSLTLLGAVALAAVALLGVVASVRARRRPEWLLGWALVVVLGLWAALRLPGVAAVTWPWFSQWYRIGPAELLFLAPYLGIGACVVAGRALAVRRHRLVGVAAVSLVLVPLLPQLADSRAMLAYDFREMSLADPGARAAWVFLASEAAPGDRVLNEHVDGSGWMYPVAGLAPVFTVKPEYYAADGDRRYLAAHAADVLTDARAAKAADDLQVRWAYVGPRTFPGRDVTFDGTTLAGSPAWRLVFEQDCARVYERVGG